MTPTGPTKEETEAFIKLCNDRLDAQLPNLKQGWVAILRGIAINNLSEIKHQPQQEQGMTR